MGDDSRTGSDARNSSGSEPSPDGFIAAELVEGRAVPFSGAAASYVVLRGVPDDEPRRLPGGQTSRNA
ncbi:hypothetical protein [Streptomyces sp. NPDC058872]|uniref:hypothetical protein n=1 Tax=Streptomyces sp. NPDC058872 TaxID=3346661 RepID=UPI0036927138